MRLVSIHDELIHGGSRYTVNDTKGGILYTGSRVSLYVTDNKSSNKNSNVRLCTFWIVSLDTVALSLLDWEGRPSNARA